MDDTNPWIVPTPDETEKPTLTGEGLAPATGPSVPQSGVPAPAEVDLLPVREQSEHAELWVLGVHGGAAESTLAGLVVASRDAGHAWPRPDDGSAARVVLTARTHMSGLLSARAAATQWAAGDVPHAEVVGLVLVADAPGRLPRPLRDFARVVGGGVPRTWAVPWIESWRLGDYRDVPRPVRRLVNDLGALMGGRPVGDHN